MFIARAMPVFDAPDAHAQADKRSATLTKFPETAGLAAFKGKEQGKILSSSLCVLCACVSACVREDRPAVSSTLTITHHHSSSRITRDHRSFELPGTFT